MSGQKIRGEGARGMSLVEAVVILSVAAVVLAVTLPHFGETRRAAVLRGAAQQIHGLLYRCRVIAIMKQQAHGLVFERRGDGSWRCFIVRDGDGDGIRRRDIQRLVDPIVSEVVFFEAGAAGLGILRSEFVPDPSGRGRLRGNLRDPVRAGRGDIITFTRRGTATPSSLYFTDHSSRMRVLRVYGATGRAVQLVWKSGWAKWRPI
jgi:hypothetical protein